MEIPILKRLRKYARRDKATGCILWTGARHERGYGLVWFEGRKQRVSRVVFKVLKKRPLRRRELALHSCDNPPCFNPDHLHRGSHRRNMLECIARGRHSSQAR